MEDGSTVLLHWQFTETSVSLPDVIVNILPHLRNSS
jgi:hypothetical protein